MEHDRMPGAARGREPEGGIALIVVLVALLLCSILALEIKSTAALHMRLAVNKRDDFLMREGMRGQLEVLKQVLLYDLSENKIEALDDIWNDEKYTHFQKAPSGEEEADRDPGEPVSSRDFELTARVEDEARKFNLNNLVVDDKKRRRHWEEVFKRLLLAYREDYPGYEISPGQADDLLEKVKEWFKRRDDERGIPRPRTGDKKKIMVTPDELLMVEGFTRDLFYDLKTGEDEEEVEVAPGLYRYLTLWSEGPVNLNTAEKPVVYALFREKDRDLADRFLEWREQEAEEQEDRPADPEAEPKKNALKSLADLQKIDGFSAEVLQRNELDASTVTFSSQRFSIFLTGTSSDGLRREERHVLERRPKGFITLLAEERNDPDYESPAAASGE